MPSRETPFPIHSTLRRRVFLCSCGGVDRLDRLFVIPTTIVTRHATTRQLGGDLILSIISNRLTIFLHHSNSRFKLFLICIIKKEETKVNGENLARRTATCGRKNREKNIYENAIALIFFSSLFSKNVFSRRIKSLEHRMMEQV